MGPSDFGGKVSASLSRVAPFTLVSGLFVFEPPAKPGEKDLGIPARVGVVGVSSNPDLIGVWSVNGAGLTMVPSLPVPVRLKVVLNNPDAPFVGGNPEGLGPF